MSACESSERLLAEFARIMRVLAFALRIIETRAWAIKLILSLANKMYRRYYLLISYWECVVVSIC